MYDQAFNIASARLSLKGLCTAFKTFKYNYGSKNNTGFFTLNKL